MPPNIIEPTIGRRLWFYPSAHEVRTGSSVDPDKMLQIREGDPFDAGVVFVWHDRMVNLAVTDHAGNQWVRTSVPLKQEGDEVATGEAHAVWMPYQAAQAKKVEAAPSLSIGQQYSHRDNLELGMLTAASHRVTMTPNRAADIACGVRTFIDTLINGPQVAPHPTPASAVREQDRSIGLPIQFADSPDFGTVTVDAAAPGSIEAEIRAKANNAPRVTPQALLNEIDSAWCFTAWEGVCGAAFNAANPDGALRQFGHNAPPGLGLLTICVLELRNGFTVIGHSACASPENYNKEIGERIARENAERQIWPLLGFRLKDDLAGL